MKKTQHFAQSYHGREGLVKKATADYANADFFQLIAYLCFHKRQLRKIGLVLLLIFLLYEFAMWKERWDYMAEDALIREQNQDPTTEAIADTMEFSQWSERTECKKKKNTIAFLKTHKTGSSTMTSIFNRYGDIHDLEIAIPRGDGRFFWPAPFMAKYVDLNRLKDKRANILDNHLVFNRREIGKVMKTGFRLVTIIREPVSQFYSLFHYLKLPQHYGLQNFTDPVEEFMKAPNKYHHSKTFNRAGAERYYEENLLLNGNLYDLNFQQYVRQDPKNRTAKTFISYLEKAFHFILITDRFDESLLLLKKMMCWDYMDIVYQKKLVNEKLHSSEHKVKVSVAKAILKWNHQDAILYKHFSERLQRIIEIQPSKDQFEENLNKFRELNRLVLKFCEESNYMQKVWYQKVMKFLKKINEKPPAEFLKRPKCFCKKLKRSTNDYVMFFAKKFPPHYFIKRLATPRVLNGC